MSCLVSLPFFWIPSGRFGKSSNVQVLSVYSYVPGFEGKAEHVVMTEKEPEGSSESLA